MEIKDSKTMIQRRLEYQISGSLSNPPYQLKCFMVLEFATFLHYSLIGV